MKKKSRGEYEDAFTKAIIKFEKMTLGRGPKSARTYFIHDMVLIRLRGMLTPAETLLVEEREGQARVNQRNPAPIAGNLATYSRANRSGHPRPEIG